MLLEQIDVDGSIQFSREGEPQAQARRFGRHVAFPMARELVRDGDPVEIGARAFDVLIVLLESQGKLVDKRKIIERVWPTTTVDESNLRFQMAALRKVLSCDRDLIKTITGRGYLLVADLQAEPPAAPLKIVPRRHIHEAKDTPPLRDALCAFLSALRGNPEAAVTLENLLRA